MPAQWQTLNILLNHQLIETVRVNDALLCKHPASLAHQYLAEAFCVPAYSEWRTMELLLIND